MRVLVTGASGFVGGHVCRELIDRSHDVTALVRRPGSAPDGVAETHGDLGVDGDVAATVATAAPDCVIHLAAEIASQRDAKRIRAVNVDGTRRLIDACQAAGSPRLVFAPAGSLYHVVDDVPIAFRDFIALTARALGVGPPRAIPAAVARLVAALSDRGRRRPGRDRPAERGTDEADRLAG